ncbi:hypothetical protein NEIMUCOT_04844 [Neisseria mucosa ATCC 25996]|uniref:Uncharacterized protein n=1 Tax=Neisseria mucosa (strain ATCC 25996 / DSM 4631 / NCTC 10774 / M26) TaxID=546266 RepID=D2ZW51_NEIM2|nr:hypothetical protein NEIMUCOT_04844 [Neisseria mucosa ATCC 25996]
MGKRTDYSKRSSENGSAVGLRNDIFRRPFCLGKRPPALNRVGQ